jgi:xanthine/CO dehydrogenase XdhC/CoxF family maturation factor
VYPEIGPMTELGAILTLLERHRDQPAVLATLVAVEGSSYRRPGARLLLLADGTRTGSISGGCLEDDVVLRAQHVLHSGRTETATYDTTGENDVVWGVGLGCRGVIRLFFEPIPVARPRWVAVLAENLRQRRSTELVVVSAGAPTAVRGTQLAADLTVSPAVGGDFREVIAPPPSLTLCGAGDDARPLVRLAKEVGWHVTVLDSRPAYATTARFAEADAVVVGSAEQLAARLAPGEESFVVVMTHRYAEDLRLLPVLLARPLAYVGVLGPRKRTDRLLAQLRSDGAPLAAAAVEQLHAPVGLDLGGTTPESVALSILAEVQCRLTGRVPIHLKDRAAPIHG